MNIAPAVPTYVRFTKNKVFKIESVLETDVQTGACNFQPFSDVSVVRHRHEFVQLMFRGHSYIAIGGKSKEFSVCVSVDILVHEKRHEGGA